MAVVAVMVAGAGVAAVTRALEPLHLVVEHAIHALP